MMPSKNPMIAVRLDPELYAGAKELAQLEGRSVANWVRYHVRLLVDERRGSSAYAAHSTQVDIKPRTLPRQLWRREGPR